MFQFGSRQGIDADVTSVSRQTIGTSAEVGSTYSTRDIGAMLRERREAMGVTLAEAEAATRIRQKYIAALESEEWHLLPGEVVGRGFLRNYSSYLGMEPTDVIERRRSVTDPRLATTLASTSAGSTLPPIRQVDYRPKEVELLDEAEGMETRSVQIAPYLLLLGALAIVALIWFVRQPLLNVGSAAVSNIQAVMARADSITEASRPFTGAIINPENAEQAAATGGSSITGTDGSGQQPSEVSNALILIPTATPTLAPPTPVPPTPTEVAVVVAVAPTEAPTETPVPLPTATSTPEAAAVAAADAPILLPTNTPDTIAPAEPEEAPEEPEVVAAAAPVCPDPRAVIISPGVEQSVNGIVGITGTATHESFQYYKLEYAPGANASGGFVYFDGANTPVNGGLLGGLDSSILPNGAYTIQLIVVDGTGNFPPPCTVTVNITN